MGDRKRTRQEEQNKKRRYDVVADGAEKDKRMEEDEARGMPAPTQ